MGIFRREISPAPFNEQKIIEAFLASGVHPDYLALIQRDISPVNREKDYRWLASMIGFTDHPELRPNIEGKFRQKLLDEYGIFTNGIEVKWLVRDEITAIVGREIAIPIMYIPMDQRTASSLREDYADAISFTDEKDATSLKGVIINTSKNLDADRELHEMTHVVHPRRDRIIGFNGKICVEATALISQFWGQKISSLGEVSQALPPESYGNSLLHPYLLRRYENGYDLKQLSDWFKYVTRDFTSLPREDYGPTTRQLMRFGREEELAYYYSRLFPQAPEMPRIPRLRYMSYDLS